MASEGKKGERDLQHELELRLTNNVVHTLRGYTANMAMAVLIKVLEALIVGASTDEKQALGFISDVSRHLKKEIKAKKPFDFGYLMDDTENDDPIIFDKINIKH